MNLTEILPTLQKFQKQLQRKIPSFVPLSKLIFPSNKFQKSSWKAFSPPFVPPLSSSSSSHLTPSFPALFSSSTPTTFQKNMLHFSEKKPHSKSSLHPTSQDEHGRDFYPIPPMPLTDFSAQPRGFSPSLFPPPISTLPFPFSSSLSNSFTSPMFLQAKKPLSSSTLRHSLRNTDPISSPMKNPLSTKDSGAIFSDISEHTFEKKEVSSEQTLKNAHDFFTTETFEQHLLSEFYMSTRGLQP